MLKTFSLVLALFLCFGIAMPVTAQTDATTGQIAGTVTDPQGAAVQGATVTITSPATGTTQSLTTTEDGTFRAVQLKPGAYTLEVTAPGFGTLTQTGYTVEVGSSLDANVTLQVTSVSEVVEVTAAGVETTQVQTPTVINQEAISQLPILGRRFQDFVLLTPTAQTDPVRGQISLVGQRGINANIQIDGADYNNPFFGGIRGGERSNQAFTFPQESIREFQVVPSGYNAEFGRSTGGIVNVVTKSGTNDFSGSAFYLGRPARLAARNAFGQVAAPTQHQYGGSIGGPLYLPRFGEGGPRGFGGRDKLFFFFAIEQQKSNQERSVLFPLLPLVNPATVAGTSEASNFFSGLQTPYTQTNDATALVGRVDYNFGGTNTFNVRYNYSRNTAENAVTAGTSLQPTTNSALSNNGTEGNSQNTVVGQLTTFLNPETVNELRAQYSRENRPRTANEISPLVNTSLGTFGTVSFLPTTQYDYRVQIADNITLNRGNHSFKFGGEYNYTFADQLFAQRQTGNFSFAGIGNTATDITRLFRILSVGTSGTGDPANRFDDPSVRYTRNVGNGLASLSSNEFAVFAQDAWRILPNLTFNYGLRYEAQFFSEPDTSNTALTNLVLNTAFPLGGVDPRVIPDLTNQFAPRAGFAYDPFSDGKTAIRGFGGIYYARTPLLTLAGPINNFRTPPGDVQLQLPSSNLPASLNTVYRQFLSIGIDLNQFPLNNLPVLSAEQVQQINSNIATAQGSTFNPLAGLQLITVGEGLKNPRSVQFGGGVERELSKGLTVGATFDYVNTVNLNRNRDIDVPTPIIRAGDMSQRPFFGLDSATPVAFRQNRPITQLGNTGYLQVREPSARSLYRALTVRGQYRRSFAQFDAFYVFSKNLDDDSTERTASFSEYDNSFNLVPEYSFSRLDRRHQFVINSVIEAPFGFQFSTVGRFISGNPIDVSVSGIVAPAGSGLTNQQYANLVTLANNTTGDLNQDRGNFSDRPYVAPGVSLQRNIFRNQPIYNVDLRVQRDFRFGERVTLAPTFEVFNLLRFDNVQLASTTATNYGNPGVNERTGEVLAPSNPNFLRLRDINGNYLLTNSPGAPRSIQLGVRLFF